MCTILVLLKITRKWVAIQANKASLPLLQFDAVLDSRTSPICKPLDLVIKPVDNPFWNTYYPPNHYRCRSTVKQLQSGKVTPNHEVVHLEKGIPDMFKTNLAKSGMIFPAGHSYWEGMPEKVFQDTIKLMPYDMQFDYIDKDLFKGRLRVHKDYKIGDDHNLIYQISAELASKGNFIDIMPKIHQNEIDWRRIIYPDGIFNKNPDIRFNGILGDIKQPGVPLKRKSIIQRINKANSQGKIAIVNLQEKFDQNELDNIVKNIFNKKDNKLIEIIFRNKGIYKHYKPL